MLPSITPTRPHPSHPARDASPLASPSLASSAALPPEAGARLASAVSVSVGTGLAGKAGYMALARAMPHASHRPLSLALVGAGAVPAWAGAGVVAEGVRQMVGGPPLSTRSARVLSALGTLAFITGMLGNAWTSLGEPETARLGDHMLANAGGQVLSMFLSEALASRLVPALVLPTRLLFDGRPVEPGSAQEAQVQGAGVRGLLIGQVLAHAPLIWQVMAQVPALQQAYGLERPLEFRPGESAPLDYLQAGLAVATAVAAVEFGRVTTGALGEAAGQAWAGARLARVEHEPEAVASEASAVVEARTLSCLQRSQRQLDRLARWLGLDEAARGRAFGYTPLLNLTANALVTVPDFGTALGVSGLANGALNLVDLALRHLRPSLGPQALPQAQRTQETSASIASLTLSPGWRSAASPSGSHSSSSLTIEISELRESDFEVRTPAGAESSEREGTWF